jgi:hypothetical protein
MAHFNFMLAELPEELQQIILEAIPTPLILELCPLLNCSDRTLKYLIGKIYHLNGFIQRIASDPIYSAYPWNWLQLLSYLDQYPNTTNLETVSAARTLYENTALNDRNLEALLFFLAGTPDCKLDGKLLLTGYLFSALLKLDLVGRPTSNPRKSIVYDWLQRDWIELVSVKNDQAQVHPNLYRELFFRGNDRTDAKGRRENRYLLSLLLSQSLSQLIKLDFWESEIAALDYLYGSLQNSLSSWDEDTEIWGLLEDAYDELSEEIIEKEIQAESDFSWEESEEIESDISSDQMDIEEDYSFDSDEEYLPN